jgi:parvulin-like peptidyl-prolyl isomerase
MVLEQLVTAEQIEEILKRQGVELKTTHILISHKKSRRSVNRSLEEARSLAAQISNDLQHGADMDKMIAEYSDDPSSKKNKGDLGYFTWGRMVQPFQEAAWNLKVGEISGPVETNHGIHVIRLDDRRNVEGYIPDDGYENVYRIKQVESKAYGDSSRVLWTKHYKSVQEKYEYILYEEAIAKGSALLKEKIKNEKLTTQSFAPHERDILFAEWEGGVLTLGSLVEKYEKQLIRVMERFRIEQNLRKEIDRLSMNQLVLRDARYYKIEDDIFVANEINTFKEDQLNRLIEQRHILDRADATETEAREYYEKYPQKFRKGAEIEIWEIYVKDKNKAEEIARKAKQDYDFETLARKYSEDKNLQSKGGYMGYKGLNSRGTVSRKAHEIGPGGKITGPIKYRRGWSVLKTGGKHEETIKPFSDVTKSAINMLKYEKALKMKEIWQRELREEYAVVIDEQKLQEI